ncbi:beta-1,3-galactosyl-O-glycosyl-glycoprotein beta-1,6-N-acetylglucosaminyltransferase 4-like, partial [Littorina saxatilis]|uniref:beta-1,3-galactosyl-O-glycosyl-glycoprotein beta-1,6-N-acetylglucosaminyltransferase 4-like n=1 Tax=Littorina saxatilis TaxID=31220 RepID=UPI0038B650A9
MVRWARRSLLLLMLIPLLYLLVHDSVDNTLPSPLSSGLALSLTQTKTAQALAWSMLYLNSTITNLACSGLVSRRIPSALKIFPKLLGSLVYDPRGRSERTTTSRGKGFCKDLKMKRGFYRWPVTQQEKGFPLAFSFKVHKAPGMFERLLSVLWRPHNFYCVHVDIKAPQDVFRYVENISRCFPNVVLTPTRLDVNYASIVSLQADLQCTRQALISPVKWKYHVNLCGQEFPLKTNLEMVQLLTALNGTNDVENYAPPASFAAGSFKFQSVISNGVNKKTNVTKEPFQHTQVEIRKGSAYNTLSRPFVEWVLNFDQ